MNKRTKKWIYTCGVALAAAMIATGCGGKDENSAPSGSSANTSASEADHVITLNASNFEFDVKEIRVKKGETISIKLVNTQGNHGVLFNGYKKEVRGNQTITFTADKEGEFSYVCSIMCGSGHGNMVGKLIVE